MTSALEELDTDLAAAAPASSAASARRREKRSARLQHAAAVRSPHAPGAGESVQARHPAARADGSGLPARPGLLPQRDAMRTLARLLTPDEHWRLFPELAAAALYLDIETTGLDEDDPITVVGLSCGHAHRARALISGRDLTRRALGRALRPARLIVTWNGAAFDLPRLRRRYPDLPWDLPHFDLALASRRLGLGGALKAVERTLGRRRPAALAGIDGAEAARLWRRHECGVRGAAHVLAEYCRADVQALIELAPLLHTRMQERFGAGQLLLP